MTKPSLELALRKERGKRIFHEWTNSLAEACGTKVSSANFLSIEHTDELKREFFRRLKAKQGVSRHNWPKHSLPELSAQLTDLCIDLRLTPVVLFSDVDEYLGAVELPATSVLLNIARVWKVVHDDFRVATPDITSGLCLEANFYDLRGKYLEAGVLEVVSWGVFEAHLTNSQKTG